MKGIVHDPCPTSFGPRMPSGSAIRQSEHSVAASATFCPGNRLSLRTAQRADLIYSRARKGPAPHAGGLNGDIGLIIGGRREHGAESIVRRPSGCLLGRRSFSPFPLDSPPRLSSILHELSQIYSVLRRTRPFADTSLAYVTTKDRGC